MARKLALITGASSGIGEEYAKQLCHEQNYDLVVVARRIEKLEALKQELENALPGCHIFAIQADLSKLDEIDRIATFFTENNLYPDLIVNNAGYGSLGHFKRSSLAWEQNMVRVNCLAPLTIIHKFLPTLISRGHGQIINVCSTCAFQPMPTMATYGATKSFMFSLTMALTAELRGTGVHIMAHCPGPTESEFHKVVGLPQKIDWLPGMKPKAVVRQALEALAKRKSFVVNGHLNSFLAYLSRYLPPALSTRVVGWILRGYA